MSSPNSSSSDAQSPSPNLRRENELLQNENTFLRLQYFNAMEMIAVLRERCKRLEAVGRAAHIYHNLNRGKAEWNRTQDAAMIWNDKQKAKAKKQSQRLEM
ncbi:hypothetical protein F5880DRAFT_1506992 [Lentinula raphanica]|nr:hypothetical protein F5880DRAFT_1506992 [Lentinula raphanica]